jgi:hypothetical protein
MTFAKDTTVSVERSKGEIERILTRYGATEFASGWKSARAIMQFRMNDRIIRFVLPLPKKEDFSTTPSGRRTRNENATLQAWEQGCRQRWRALLLSIKAKLESAESGIEEFETAFMGQIVMPNGKTMAEIALPQIELAYQSGKMPVALLEY